MFEIRKNITPVRLALGGGVMAISAGILNFGSEFGLKSIFLPGGTCLFVLGILLFLTGIIEFVHDFKMIPKWDDKLIKDAIQSAPNNSTIRILQTWLPDKEYFCPILERLLMESEKQFRLEVLLMNSDESNNLLDARIKLRSETRNHAQHEIHATITRLAQMKQRVDAVWEKKYSGAKLNLKIRSYEFMPFGPYYQIGKNKIFLGFYLNYDSSVHGPMLVISNSKSEIWTSFEQNFVKGWKDAQNTEI